MNPPSPKSGFRAPQLFFSISSSIVSLALLTIPSLLAQPTGVDQQCRVEFNSTGTPFLRWQGVTGRNYFVQVSDSNDHLAKWNWAPIIEAGQGTLIEHEVAGTTSKAFFRLAYTSQIIPPGKTLDTADFDGDGLTNLQEITPYFPPNPSGTPLGIQTNPLNADTDGDGLSDKAERDNGSDPTNPGSNPPPTPTPPLPPTPDDLDGDGLSNADELLLGTNPNTPDTDNDGLLDGEDADPKEILIDWKKSPEQSYVIIDLNMDSVASNTDSRGRTLVPAVLNDKMQIVMGKDSDLYHWDGTSVQPQWAKLGDFAGRETRPTPSSGLAYTNSNRIYSNYSFPIQDNDLPFYFDESSIASFPLEFESPTSAPQFALGVPTELLRHRTIVARFDQFAVAEEAWPPDTCPDDQTCDPKPIEYSIQSPNFILPKTTREIRISSRINPHSAAPGISRTGKIATSEYLLDESSWKYRIGSVDVPDYVTALTSDPLDRDLIIVGESTSTKRYRNEAWETMPLPGIMDMNKGGTGITYPDQQIWRNGKTIVLDTLLSESIWENIQVEQINKDGALLGSAEPKGSNTIKPVLLLPVDITVAFGLGPEPLGEQTSRELLEEYLETIKVSRTGDTWLVKFTDAQGVQKLHGVEIVTTKEKLIDSLKRAGQKVVFDGHSNFGLGPNLSGKVTHKTIADFTHFGVGKTSIPKSFRGDGTETDIVPFANGDGTTLPTNPQDLAAIDRVYSEGWAYLKLEPGHIIEAPENYQITELGIERFKNVQGVAPGSTFTKQGNGFNNEWHFDNLEGSRRLIVLAPSTDIPTLGYAKFFYNACNTGRDYIESFKHGDFIYTKDSCRVETATTIFVQGIIEGKSNDQIMTDLNQNGVGNAGDQSPQIYGYKTF